MCSFLSQFGHNFYKRLLRSHGVMFYRNKHTSNANFEQVEEKTQPRPLSAQTLAKQTPIEIVEASFVYCDGGSYMGHPRIFINLVVVFVLCP